MGDLVDLAPRRQLVEIISVEPFLDGVMDQIATASDGQRAARLASRELARCLVNRGTTPDELIEWAATVSHYMAELLGEDEPQPAA
jgi:hypothetical protein